MAHPFQDRRAHKMEHSRVGRIAGGAAKHSDVREDRALITSMVKPSAMKAAGGPVSGRADRPNRARGGSVKKSKGTTVNVIVGPAGGVEQPRPTPAIAPPPAAPPVAMTPPRPPMAPPMAPPGVAPGPLMRKRGGKVDASQGATEVQHDDNMASQRKDMNRKPVITRAAGGPVESDGKKGAQMAPKLPSGAGGARARLAKAHKRHDAVKEH